MVVFISDLKKITDTKYSIGYMHNMPFDSVNGLGKTKEQLEKDGMLVESISEPQQEGKQAVMFWNPIEKKIFYEYVDIPKKDDLQERLTALEKSNAELMALISTMGTPTT